MQSSPQNFEISKILLLIFCCSLCVLIFSTLLIYPGRGYVYVIFSIVFNGLLLAGFRKNKIFFDTFIGIFLWLGFWFKSSFIFLFYQGRFPDPTGDFDYSGSSFDHALLVGSIGAIAIAIASFIREKYLFSYSKFHVVDNSGSIFEVYKRYRKFILVAFVSFFILVGGTNLWLGIYQRGLVPQTILPFGLNGIYTFLLLFGLTSFSAVFLEFELRINKNPYLVAMLSLLETFCSNVSILSRGMILNTSALIFGVNEAQKTRTSYLTSRFKIIILLAFIVLFISSVFVVHFERAHLFPIESRELSMLEAVRVSYKGQYGPASLLVNRWVGIEGAMAVSSYPNLGWDLWTHSWQEKFSNNGTTFYDKEVAKSWYNDMNLLRHHFMSLPGIVAFFYYPGSYVILFFSMILLGIIGAVTELFVYKVTGSNMILCSLMAEVIAYRYAHFGYAPKQSYLLVGAIFLNVIMIWFLNKICRFKLIIKHWKI